MELIAQAADPADIKADWLIVGIWEQGALAGAAAAVDSRLEGILSRLRQSGDITGKAKEITTLLACKGIAAQRILVVGLGQAARADRPDLLACAQTASRAITGKPHATVAFALPESPPGMDAEELASLMGAGLMQGCEGPGLHKKEPDRFPPKSLVIVGTPLLPIQKGIARAAVEGEAVSLARRLVNMPPCDLYPETFAAQAEQVAGQAGVDCDVLDQARLEAERMGSLLAVARGSDRPPRLVVLRYHGGGSKTLGLVGKGVTFDSGGLSLKTNEQMADMKCDMAGAAAVLGAVCAIARLKLPLNVLGILALVENLPGGKAMKLGDVLRARNGKTIEVLNTDAEGRLILADALSYAVDLKSDHLVDLATLTGSCMVALGTDVAGVMSNDESWQKMVLRAAEKAGERVWPLPMFPLYAEMIKSDVADMKNVGGSRWAGAVSAAKFLEEFVGSTPWVHLDIAGPAWVEKESPTRAAGGTGCFVRSLVELARMYSTETSPSDSRPAR